MIKIEKLLKLDAFIYFLGYLWADGSVSKDKKSTTLYIQEEDAREILPNISKIGEILSKPFSTGLSKPKKAHWKTMMRFYSGDNDLYYFLVQNGYLDKSKKPPTKILEIIPEEKHNLFYLGFFDGDGCAYNGEKSHKLYCFSFSGPFDYDWGFLEAKFCELDIKSRIYRYKRKKGANSSILATGMFHVEKWSDYIYTGSEEVAYLSRKKRKCFEIIEHIKNITSLEKGVSRYGGKYHAHLTRNCKRIELGTFDSEDEAIKIRRIAVKIYDKLLSELQAASDPRLLPN
jgi:hypothetical protein